MFFHNINGTGVTGNQVDPLAPFLEFLAVKEDAVQLMLRKRKAEIVQALEKLFMVTHGFSAYKLPSFPFANNRERQQNFGYSSEMIY
jgi:hypothetical protein